MAAVTHAHARAESDFPKLPAGSVAVRLDELATLVSECNADALSLRERLIPAMFSQSPPPDPNCLAVAASPTCEIGERIDSIADSAREVKRVLNDIAVRLAI